MYNSINTLINYTSAFTNTLECMNNLTKGTIFSNPACNSLVDTLKAFTPKTDKPEWRIKGHKARMFKYMNACELVKFIPESGSMHDESIVIVAPISGHYATLLSDTVERLTDDYNVYITDWRNVRDHPEIADYGMDEYVKTLSEVFKCLPNNTHILAVCQGCVPSLMALCGMDHSDMGSITLMAGPIDTRIGRTSINEFCDGKDIDWFTDNVICSVPKGFKSEGLNVYPGLLQLSGFMSMNPESHQKSFMEHYSNGLYGDSESVDKIGSFYDEYMSVMDISAPFYLDMIGDIFLDQELVKGHSLESIICPVMVIEGEDDDICGLGQTASVFNHIHPRPENKYYIQEGVGHYGCFSGSKWREEIAPEIISFHKVIDNS